MERLSELVNFVSKYKSSKIEIVGDSSDTLLNKLYHGLADKQFDSDKEAALGLGYTDPKNPSYKKLKYLLERRLINSVFFIDLNSAQFNDEQRAQVSCYRNFAAFRILLARGANKTAFHLAEKTIRIAQKYELTLIVFDLASSLHMRFSSFGNKPKKGKYYKDLMERAGTLYQLEILARDYFNEILGEISGKRGSLNNQQLIQKSQKYYSEIIEKTIGYYSNNLYYSTNQIRILGYEMALDSEKVIEVCKEAIEYYKPLDYKKGLMRFNIQLLIAYISLEKFEEAYSQAERTFFYISKGTMTWFAVKEVFLLLCFRTKNYDLALEIYEEVLSDKKFKVQSKTHKEPWKVHEAYINFFMDTGKIEARKTKHLKKFKLAKFLNEVPMYSKDKSGLNVQILIVQVLFLFRNGKIDKAIDKVAAMTQYNHKHLRKDHTFRSNCFIKMLVILITSQFHKTATLRKTKKYLNLLHENSALETKQSIGVEVVPYEDLWEMITADLEDKFNYTPKRKKRVEELFPQTRRK